MSINPHHTLKIRRLPNGDNLPLPDYQTPGAAGMDLYAAVDSTLKIFMGDICLVSTGIAVEIPHGFEGQIRPRSSMARKGFIIPNAPGTIDCDYRGELMVLLFNPSTAPYLEVRRGDRIAQLIIAPVLQLPVIEIEALSETVRGEGGFGSTGR